MTDTNDVNPVQDQGTAQSPAQTAPESAQAAPAPVKPKRNSRRTPRRTLDDSNLLFDVPAAAPAPRTRRRRAADAVTVEEAAPASVPAPVAHSASSLSDEIAVPVISVPRRPEHEDVPMHYSSDEDSGPAPEPAPRREREEAPADSASGPTGDSAGQSSRGLTAAERRRDRRQARLSRYPEEARDSYSRDSGDDRDNGYARDEDRGEDRSDRGESRDGDSVESHDDSDRSDRGDDHGEDRLGRKRGFGSVARRGGHREMMRGSGKWRRPKGCAEKEGSVFSGRRRGV